MTLEGTPSLGDWLDRWRLDPPAVGVRVLGSPQEGNEARVYRGVSYCDAVRRAGEGEILRIVPGSIQVCQWAPVVLGLKVPESRFEERLRPRLPYPTPGLLLARLDAFPGEPHVVIVRSEPEVFQEMIGIAGQDRLWPGKRGDVAQSAAGRFTGGPVTARHRLVEGINQPLAVLARSARWRALTHWLFRSRVVSAGFEALISRTLADMSICRNSTAVPLLTGCANVSYFCTGGITWGRNHPRFVTAGWPASLLREQGQ